MQEFFAALKNYSENQGVKDAIVIWSDGGYFRKNYLQLWGDITQSSQIKSGREYINLIEGRTAYDCMVSYLSTLYAGGIPAFYAPMTARQDPEIYSTELKILKENFSVENTLSRGTSFVPENCVMT